jgi:plastocyanin
MRSTRSRLRTGSNSASGVNIFVAVSAATFLASVATVEAAVVHVDAHGIAFVPAAIKAHAGDVVEWTNKDFVAHTATARSGAWDISLPVGKTGRVTLTKAGAIDYYCRVHPNMTGRIDVSAK